MFPKTVLPALAALGLSVSSVSADVCTENQVSINSAADASALRECTTVKGTVTIGTQASGDIAIEGPKSIEGDLICADNGGLLSLTSSSLTSVAGAFTMRNVTAITTLTMPKLKSVQALDWQTLSRLENLSFGTAGLQEADTIRISDTFLSSINAIRTTSSKRMEIDNNRRLSEWDSDLQTLSDELIITSNGYNLNVAFPNLIWIANMTMSNISQITVPSLQVVNGSMRFDSNFFPEFSAPNMTNTQDGDISFTNNGELANISFPILTTIAGGFTIANNTGLAAIDGFPQLRTVGGAVRLRGNFETVELPALNDVKGAFNISSTEDIEDVCSDFRELSSQNGNGKIQGTFTCDPLNANANDDPNGDGSSGGSNGDDEGAGAIFGSSLPVVFTIAALGGMAQLFM